MKPEGEDRIDPRERVREYLRQHPGTRLMGLEGSDDPVKIDIAVQVKIMLRNGELIEHPKTKVLMFPGEGPVRSTKDSVPTKAEEYVLVRMNVATRLTDAEGVARDLRVGDVVTLPNTTAKALVIKEMAVMVDAYPPIEVKAEGATAEGSPSTVPVASGGSPGCETPPTTPAPDEGDVSARQREWLEKLQAVQDEQSRKPRPIRIQHRKTDTWHPWNECQHKDRIITAGTLLNEIVFDFDTEDWSAIIQEGNKLLTYLKNEVIPHQLAWSGGKGIHIHVFVDMGSVEPDPALAEHLEDRAEYGLDVSAIVRRALNDHIAAEAGMDIKRAGLDPLKVDFSTARKGSMMRAYGCLRPKAEKYAGGVKTLLDSIPERRPRPGELPLVFPEKIGLWNIGALSSIINDALRAEIQEASREAFTPKAIEGPLSSIPCYSYLRANGAPLGLRNEGALTISIFNQVHGRLLEEARDEVRAYSRACSPSGELEREHLDTLEGVYKRTYKGASCKHIRGKFGEKICIKGRCPICIQARADKSEDKGRSRNGSDEQVDFLLQLARQDGEAEFFHDAANVPFIRVVNESHHEVKAVGEQDFSDWLKYQAVKVAGHAPKKDPLNQAIDTISVLARFEGEEREVYIRKGAHDGAFYYDLCNASWQSIRISADGWQVVDDPPVMFRRFDTMRPQVIPLSGRPEALDEIVRLINTTPERRRLLKYQIAAFNVADINHYNAFFLGPQGSTKSTGNDVVKALDDPGTDNRDSLPLKEDDLDLILSRRCTAAFDNISRINLEISDKLTKANSMGRSSRRTLYTNNDENGRRYRTKIILNAIGLDGGVRPDLLDRTIIYNCEVVDESQRLGQGEVNARIDQLLPYAFGAALDLLVKAIPIYEQLSDCKGWSPRLKDAYLWMMAIAKVDGMGEEEFEILFKKVIEQRDSDAIEGDPLAIALEHVAEIGGFVGTAAQLHELLNAPGLDIPELCQIDTKDKAWPRGGIGIGMRLPRIIAPLRSRGVYVYQCHFSEIEETFGDGIKGLTRAWRDKPYIDQDRMIIISKDDIKLVEQSIRG
ncbi:MAG: hypothetical protein GXX95_03970 [Methanomassiliicoccus sp.]|nr:hypothetical protein [Methanomassiliicoccus sp.]